MTELPDVRAAIEAHLLPEDLPTFPGRSPIQVDEAARTVTVEAGVPLRLLLDFLSEYR